MKRQWLAGVLGLLLAGCNASTSDVGGGRLTATGCRSRVALRDQMRIRAEWTAPKIARYTLIRLEGVRRFTIKSVVDETKSDARPNGVSGEYDLPGPQSPGTKKTIVALIVANKGSKNTITTRVWGSGNAVSTPPDNAASVRCAVAVTP
jgi:hypothetical protein